MAISNKQKELDVIKWIKSVNEGKDACGSFEFCVKCDKNVENPCEKAFNAFYAKKTVAKKTAPAKKVESKAPAKKTAKKETAVKTPAKKEVAATKVATKKPAEKTAKKSAVKTAKTVAKKK